MRYLLVLGLILATACVFQSTQPEMAKSTAMPEEVQVEIEKVALPNLGPAPELQRVPLVAGKSKSPATSPNLREAVL